MRQVVSRLLILVFVSWTVPAPGWIDAWAAESARDPRAVKIAEAVLQAMGGRQAWNETRHVSWKFFGGREHYWDRHTGDIRIDSPQRERDGETSPAFLILMNIRSMQGRVWESGVELKDAEKRKEYLRRGHEIWVNDSYWMFMPYKLLDPGVTLRYSREAELVDGRAADVLDLTFGAGVGYTPENRYEVYVARDSALVEQWSFFADAAESEAGFTMPWSGWKRFGKIRLATDHGRQRDWNIQVFDKLSSKIYESPAPPN